MVQKKYVVRLSSEEKRHLRKVVRSGRSSAQAITRARILLKVDEGWTAVQVATALDISERDDNTSQEAVCARGVGGDAAPAQPGQPVPEAGRTWGSASDCPGLQPSPRGPRPLDPAVAGGEDGGTGPGGIPVPRDGAAAPEKTPLSRCRSSGGAFPR